MKTVTVIVLCTLIFSISGYLIKVPIVPTQPRVSSVGWLHIQKLILPFFDNICDDSINPTIVRLAEEFNSNISGVIFNRPEVLTNFEKFKTNGFISKGQIFTNYDYDHLIQLRTLYDVLFYAKDFDTFYKVAAWARQNVNCGLFINAIYLAILNRRDTQNIIVPAPYELLPNYFIQKDTILKSSALLSGEGAVTTDENVRYEGNAYVIDANYTSNIFVESNLAYFHEDIGLNSYYFLQKLKRSPWFNNSPELHINYGEYLYHMMKQLNARYGLERYANELPELENISCKEFTAASYDPALIYNNGNEFGYRTTELKITNDDDLQMLENIESNIVTVVTHLRDTGYNKSQILNHLMDILVTGERSFETIMRKTIAKDNIFTESQPSVLENYMTSLRDPVFWKINKHIVDLIDRALKELPSYTRNELYFPGIEVINVEIKKMTTSFDYYEIDVTDALKSTAVNSTFQVKIGQPRLNHKPFSIKLNISSLVTQKGFVKLFLGPKVAPGELAIKRGQFMLLESFEYTFKKGINVISRASGDLKDVTGDFMSLRELQMKIQEAEFGLNVLPFDNIHSISGFPSRLILPKGTADGIPFQVFVLVAPFVKPIFDGLFAIPNVEFNSATLSPGYPFDLNIPDYVLFDLPNSMLKDVIITHKGDKILNYGIDGVTKKWKETSSSSGSDYSSKNKEPFDYQSKKAQYGKKQDFPVNEYQSYNYGPKTEQNNKKQETFSKLGKDAKVFRNDESDEEPLHSNPIVFQNFRNSEETLSDYDKNLAKDAAPQFKSYSEKVDTPEYEENLFSPSEVITKKPRVYDYLLHYDYDNYDTYKKVYE